MADQQHRIDHAVISIIHETLTKPFGYSFTCQDTYKSMSICINHFYLSACRKPMFHICVHLISTLFENMYMSWHFHRLDAYEMFHITATLKIHFPLPWFSSSMLLSDAIVSLHFHSDGFWTARTLYGKWITRKDFSGLLWRFFLNLCLCLTWAL